MSYKKVPNPGSVEARKKGCICPVMDNEYGAGYMGNPNVFVRVEGCPLHWDKAVSGLRKCQREKS